MPPKIHFMPPKIHFGKLFITGMEIEYIANWIVEGPMAADGFFTRGRARLLEGALLQYRRAEFFDHARLPQFALGRQWQ